jgi:hypothetical protein
VDGSSSFGQIGERASRFLLVLAGVSYVAYLGFSQSITYFLAEIGSLVRKLG